MSKENYTEISTKYIVNEAYASKEPITLDDLIARLTEMKMVSAITGNELIYHVDSSMGEHLEVVTTASLFRDENGKIGVYLGDTTQW